MCSREEFELTSTAGSRTGTAGALGKVTFTVLVRERGTGQVASLTLAGRPHTAGELRGVIEATLAARDVRGRIGLSHGGSDLDCDTAPLSELGIVSGSVIDVAIERSRTPSAPHSPMTAAVAEAEATPWTMVSPPPGLLLAPPPDEDGSGTDSSFSSAATSSPSSAPRPSLTEFINEIKVCVVGERGVGKTSVVLRFVQDRFADEYADDEGVVSKGSYWRVLEIDGRVFSLDIMDTTDSQPEWFGHATASAWAMVVVFSLESRTSLDGARRAWERAIRAKGIVVGGPAVPCVLVGTHLDAAESAGKRQTSRHEGEKAAQAMHASYFEVSCKSGAGIQQAFAALTRTYLAAYLPQSRPRRRSAPKCIIC